MSAPLIVVAVLVLLAIVIIARTVNIIQQGYVGIVKRLGEYHSVRKHIYQLYELVNHLQLFGAEYLKPLTACLERVGQFV